MLKHVIDIGWTSVCPSVCLSVCLSVTLWHHCARYHGQMSDLLQISASIIQGSAIEPASYDVTASDLAAASPGNILCKYADYTYVIIPVQNVDTRTAELLNIEAWARDNTVDACVGLNWLLVSFLSHINKNIIHSIISHSILPSQWRYCLQTSTRNASSIRRQMSRN